ncbi:unnamed protein product [Acanthosepion pharaonis]|uniref:Uncharacterized protein n=1 Tax=Acanthosepion pharaonis TaxID=158019 RepID=A0A812B651_ACAPH|nr:unnamed protein product [Sepia pharaonis]
MHFLEISRLKLFSNLLVFILSFSVRKSLFIFSFHFLLSRRYLSSNLYFFSLLFSRLSPSLILAELEEILDENDQVSPPSGMEQTDFDEFISFDDRTQCYGELTDTDITRGIKSDDQDFDEDDDAKSIFFFTSYHFLFFYTYVFCSLFLFLKFLLSFSSFINSPFAFTISYFLSFFIVRFKLNTLRYLIFSIIHFTYSFLLFFSLFPLLYIHSFLSYIFFSFFHPFINFFTYYLISFCPLFVLLFNFFTFLFISHFSAPVFIF